MQSLRHFLDFYINSSIHVALTVCCLSWITLLEYGYEANYELFFFIFFATITGYNFVKYFGLAKFHHRRLASWLKYIQLFSLFCFLGLCYFTLRLPFVTLVYLGALGIITFLYAVPFLPRRYFLDQSMNLRAISGLKIYIIAFVWAGTTVIIPIINEGGNLEFDVFITALQRYIYVLVATLPFEIRDMQFDNLKLSTIPQKIGIKRTKQIGLILMIGFCLLEFFKDEITQINYFIIIVVAIIVSLSVRFSNVKRSKYYSSFWVEGIPLLWLALVLMMT